MHVFLTGFMGAGKTTLGRSAAQQLGWPFLDLDELIESQQSLSIREIFETKGEAYFRQLERDAITFVVGLQEPHIVATGGGTPCQGDNMERLRQGGLTLYLKPDTDLLIERLRTMRSERPKLREIPEDQIPQVIHHLLSAREPYYQRAHHMLQGESLSAEHIVQLVQAELSQN